MFCVQPDHTIVGIVYRDILFQTRREKKTSSINREACADVFSQSYKNLYLWPIFVMVILCKQSYVLEILMQCLSGFFKQLLSNRLAQVYFQDVYQTW